MSIITSNPTINQTPDPTLGGLAVTGISNTGHGSTNTASSAFASAGFGSDSDFDIKSARWSSFQSVSGQIASIRLKFNWTAEGSASADDGGGGGSANSSCQIDIDYSLNGGTNWTNQISRSASAFAPGGGSGGISDSGSVDIVLSPTQNISQIQVRDSMQTAASANGGEFIGASSSSSITTTISNIRLEVETVDTNHLLVMM